VLPLRADTKIPRFTRDDSYARGDSLLAMTDLRMRVRRESF